MNRASVLLALPCNVAELPIGALEAFVLSMVQGRPTAEQVAEETGLEVDELLRVAKHLVDLGALAVEGEPAKTRRPPPKKTKQPPAMRKTERPAALRSTAPGPKTLVPPALVPKVRPASDVKSMGLGPREGFVLSQIDGATSTEDLVAITHLSHEDLSDALHALEDAGAVELGHRKRKPTKAPPPRATKAPPPRPTKAPRARATKAPPKRASVLPPEEHTRIAEAAARMHDLDHFAVLGVDRDAEPKAIRRAYHALAAQFHPDRYFRKDLGASRQVLERIFSRVTLAYDTLSKKETRDAYELTLPPRPAPRAPSVKPPPVVEEAPRAKSVRPAVPPPPVAAPPPPPAPPAPPPVAPPPPPAAIAPPPASSPLSVDPLLRLYAGKKKSAVRERVEVFLRAAREALDRDDVVAAANHYRLAVQCTDDPAIRAAFEATDEKARARVRDTSLTAARAAEGAGRWPEAAAKYAKAYGAHPEPWIAERAANAMRNEGGDLRAAARLAEQALLAEPNNVGYHVTLGEICLDAGMMARAAGEAQRALALAPGNARAVALSQAVARVKRA